MSGTGNRATPKDVRAVERIQALAISILGEVAPFTTQNRDAAQILGLATRLKFRLDPQAKAKHKAVMKKYRDKAIKARFRHLEPAAVIDSEVDSRGGKPKERVDE